MKELSLLEIQNIELKILLEFDKICRKQNFKYSLGGGTLLGAIRHKGFIPWDDDIDVMMPRPDYDAFLDFCKKNNTDFKVITYELEPAYYGLFAKLSDRNSKIIDDVLKTDFTIGVNIDIFPLDGLGNSYKEAIKIFQKTEISREILNAALWKKYKKSKTHGYIYEPIRFIMYILSRISNPQILLKKVDDTNKQIAFNSSKYAGCICGSYRLKEIMKQNIFTHYIDVQFENHYLKAIKNYDEYLQKHYGNYMQLPPKNQQITHHTYKAFEI